MEAIRACIVDDEKNARELLRRLLKDIGNVEISGEAESADDAFKKLLESPADIVFLDIQMPRKSGFDLVEQIKYAEIETDIVFITAYEEYAIKAIKASAFDYLLKPVKRTDLEQTIQRFSERKDNRSLPQRLEKLIHSMKSRRIKISDRTGFQMIDPEHIMYCEADGNYSRIILAGNNEITASMNLGKLEAHINHPSFIRISRSVIINLKFLVRVDRKSCHCILNNGQKITLSLSRKYLKELENMAW